ncbi:prepilin-type N-terminal cleavage/methylation domain-containing protein [Candidatus Saccharibacteria bacterium]|nr:prepilin-type N-terminal cleavage/methylation domain-containing protein [Candidatus Saccharibacteria bacterium]
MFSKLFTIHYSLFTHAKRVGFTLLELLVVVGLIGIIGAIAADIFVNVSRSYNKANIIAEVERNGNIALSQMVGEIRNARSATSPDAQTLDIVNASGVNVTFSFTPQTASDNGYVARNGTPLTDSSFASGVNVTSLVFSLADTDPQVVSITMSLSQPLGVSSRVDFQAGTTIQTSVSLRTYE